MAGQTIKQELITIKSKNMKTMFLKSILLSTLLFTSCLLLAQSDQKGCKDHPLFTRLPGFYISECTESFDVSELVVAYGKKQTIEGSINKIRYSKSDNAEKKYSRFQLIKNFEDAIIAKGGEKVYVAYKRDDSEFSFSGGTFKMTHEGNTYWVCVTQSSGEPTDCEAYNLEIIKIEGMNQEISANAMFEQVNSGKALTLYINFDTGKSTIKSESQSIVNELFKMLNDNPTMKITIEGHTDNVGNSESNKTLSGQRAASVKTALINMGISADRIKTIGYGQYQPIADNSTEDGKAKNRRVEIKKQ